MIFIHARVSASSKSSNSIGEGLTSREISVRLNLGPSTVDSYRARIKQKLALKNAAELYQRAALWVAAREA